MITQMTTELVGGAVDVHMKGFKGFFLTFLGEKFLKLYYQGIVNHRDAIKFVYIEDGKVKGFIVGTMDPSGFYSDLLKQDWFRFGLAALPSVFKKPQSFFRLLRAFTKPSQTVKDRGIAELSSIAVLPNAQGGGVGKSLVSAFASEVKKRGGKAIYLTTDVYNNDPANAFYQRNGFEIKRVIETPEKRAMNEYWLHLT